MLGLNRRPIWWMSVNRGIFFRKSGSVCNDLAYRKNPK
jgi:hypothetical protein